MQTDGWWIQQLPRTTEFGVGMTTGSQQWQGGPIYFWRNDGWWYKDTEADELGDTSYKQPACSAGWSPGRGWNGGPSDTRKDRRPQEGPGEALWWALPPVWHPSESIPRPRLPPLSRVSKAPSTQSRSRSRSRSPVARRKSPPHHSPPFRSVTPPPRHSSPSRSVTPVMDEAEAADVESGSDCNLLELMCGWKIGERRQDPRCPQWPEAQGGATLKSRSVRQIDGTIDQ